MQVEREDGEFGFEGIGDWERARFGFAYNINIEGGGRAVKGEVCGDEADGACDGETYVIGWQGVVIDKRKSGGEPVGEVVSEDVCRESRDGRGRDGYEIADAVGGDDFFECGDGGNESPAAKDD